MQYALLIYRNPAGLAQLSAAEQEEVVKEYWDLRSQPGMVGGAGLQGTETATTVRTQDGQTLITDGPFADTKEFFGGFYLFEADNLDQATEMAARIPDARLGGAIEVRPVLDTAG